MQDHEPIADANDPPRRAALAWLAQPWVLLAVSIVILVGGWVGLGLLTEHRRQAALDMLEHQGRVELAPSWGCISSGRLPDWLPGFVGHRLPDSLQFQTDFMIDCRFLGRATDADVALVNRIPEIMKIKFDDASELSESSLIKLMVAHDLRHLWFEVAHRPTAAQYAALSQQQNLYHLGTLAGPFDQHAINSLSQIKVLTMLSLDGPATAANLVGLTGLSSARSINWQHSNLTDEQFAQLDGLGKYFHLGLKETGLTAKSWPLLSGFNAISLTLESPSITDETLHYLAKNTKLSAVSLSGGLITDKGIAELSSASKLSHLQLDAVELSLASARALASMPKLCSITLRDGSDVTDEWLTELSRLELRQLDINSSQVTDAGVAALADQPLLDQLSLAESHITDAALSTLGRLKLSCVDLRYTAITDSGLLSFARPVDSKTNVRLYVAGTQITKAGADTFLKWCPNAQVIGVPGGASVDHPDWVMPLKRRSPTQSK